MEVILNDLLFLTFLSIFKLCKKKKKGLLKKKKQQIYCFSQMLFCSTITSQSTISYEDN